MRLAARKGWELIQKWHGSPRLVATVSGIGDRMNTRYLPLVLNAVIVISVTTNCTQYSNGQASRSAIHGTWAWHRSTGGFTGRQVRTPDTTGHTKTIRFTPLCFREYHDDSLMVATTYTIIERRPFLGQITK